LVQLIDQSIYDWLFVDAIPRRLPCLGSDLSDCIYLYCLRQRGEAGARDEPPQRRRLCATHAALDVLLFCACQ